MFTYSTDSEPELKLIIVFAIDSCSIFVKIILGSLENMFRGNYVEKLLYVSKIFSNFESGNTVVVCLHMYSCK